MNVWVLRDGDDLLTGLGGRVPAGRIASYADACELHVCDYETEGEATREAEVFNRTPGARWTPHAMEFPDADPEDFAEHFED